MNEDAIMMENSNEIRPPHTLGTEDGIGVRDPHTLHNKFSTLGSYIADWKYGKRDKLYIKDIIQTIEGIFKEELSEADHIRAEYDFLEQCNYER